MDLDDECQVIHGFSFVKCCFCYLNIFFNLNMIHIFLMICHRKFHVFHKAFLVGHVVNQCRKSYSGRHARLTKEKVTEMLRASRRHHLCLRSTMHILALYLCGRGNFNHSQKIITKCDGIITNCESLVYYKVRWTVITNCDSFFITKCDTVYYKLRQVLQSAMDLL